MTKEKEPNYLEILTHLIKSLTTEIVELKQRTSETTLSSKPTKYNMLRRGGNSSSRSSHLENSVQSSNVALNIGKIGMDQYYMFHQEHHSKNMCPQWNQVMSRMVAQLVHSIIFEE